MFLWHETFHILAPLEQTEPKLFVLFLYISPAETFLQFSIYRLHNSARQAERPLLIMNVSRWLQLGN